MERATGIDPQMLANTLRESLRRGSSAILTVSSRSMMPLFLPGDQVVLTAVSPAGLQTGDVITYLNGRHLITHRYWGEKAGSLLVRGDRPVQFDPPVQKEQLIGRVQARRRNGRILPLDSGRGAWLNRRLANLARREQHWLARRLATPPDGQSTGLPPILRLWPDRVRRRLTLAWAILLCGLVGITARKE